MESKKNGSFFVIVEGGKPTMWGKNASNPIKTRHLNINTAINVCIYFFSCIVSLNILYTDDNNRGNTPGIIIFSKSWRLNLLRAK